jgi:hypothetical protein
MLIFVAFLGSASRLGDARSAVTRSSFIVRYIAIVTHWARN